MRLPVAKSPLESKLAEANPEMESARTASESLYFMVKGSRARSTEWSIPAGMIRVINWFSKIGAISIAKAQICTWPTRRRGVCETPQIDPMPIT